MIIDKLNLTLYNVTIQSYHFSITNSIPKKFTFLCIYGLIRTKTHTKLNNIWCESWCITH